MTRKIYPKTAAIVIAFPAMGKTVTAKTAENIMDLDFGMFRQALGCSKIGELTIAPAFVRLLRQYLNEGWIVMINDPKIMRFLRAEELDLTQMFLPSDLSYASAKMHVAPDQVAMWVQNWHAEARRLRVPVTYLPIGLDEYIAHGCPRTQADDDLPLQAALAVRSLSVEEGLSPTGEFCKNANKAKVRCGFNLRNASPGLRSFSKEEWNDHCTDKSMARRIP